jgi:hypothetical protein
VSKRNKKRPALPRVTGERREPGREPRATAARIVEQQRRRDRRRSILIQVAVGLVVVVAVVATTLAVLNERASDNPVAATPPGLTEDGAVRFGGADAPVTVQVVEDFSARSAASSSRRTATCWSRIGRATR